VPGGIVAGLARATRRLQATARPAAPAADADPPPEGPR